MATFYGLFVVLLSVGACIGEIDLNEYRQVAGEKIVLENGTVSIMSSYSEPINKTHHEEKSESAAKHIRQADDDNLMKFREKALAEHNKFRMYHGVPPLKLNDELNARAQKYAMNMTKTRKFEHSNAPGLGENLYFFHGPELYAVDAASNAVSAWYAEIEFYDFKNAKFATNIGHFTQVVWSESAEVGFGYGSVKDPKGSRYKITYVVANYSPAGNNIAKFAECVPKILDQYADKLPEILKKYGKKKQDGTM